MRQKRASERCVVELSPTTKAALRAEAEKNGTSMAFIIRGLVDGWSAAKTRARVKHGVTKASRLKARPIKRRA